MDQSVRRKSAQEMLDDEYEARVAETVARQREAYETQFGPAFREKHPFKADLVRANKEVMELFQSE